MVGDKKRLNLVLVFTGGDGFPVGGAYTNRVLAFAKGFVENKCNVTILIIYPGRNNQAEIRGSMDGFDYIFCAGLKRPKSKHARKLIGIKGIFSSVSNVYKLNRKKHIDAIITFSQKFSQNLPIFLFTRFNRIVFIRENNEFPMLVIKRGHRRLTLLEKIYFKFVNRFYDGYIYISSTLVSFNKNMLVKRMPIEVVPIIVDKERFNIPDLQRKNRITYCGNLFGEKDGVKILLAAFSNIHINHPEYKLLLIGDTSGNNEFNALQQLIKDYGIESKVEFTGFVHRKEIP
ncbi:MAG: glycosyltransferase, partial [Bacteroidales bacterium]|nr:glycosyltransferase [Bacteroidales bacterium]